MLYEPQKNIIFAETNHSVYDKKIILYGYLAIILRHHDGAKRKRGVDNDTESKQLFHEQICRPNRADICKEDTTK